MEYRVLASLLVQCLYVAAGLPPLHYQYSTGPVVFKPRPGLVGQGGLQHSPSAATQYFALQQPSAGGAQNFRTAPLDAPYYPKPFYPTPATGVEQKAASDAEGLGSNVYQKEEYYDNSREYGSNKNMEDEDLSGEAANYHQSNLYGPQIEQIQSKSWYKTFRGLEEERGHKEKHGEIHYHEHKHLHKHEHKQEHKHKHESKHDHKIKSDHHHHHGHKHEHKNDHHHKHGHKHEHKQDHHHKHDHHHGHKHGHHHGHKHDHHHDHKNDHHHKHDHHHGHKHDHKNEHKHDHHHGHKQDHHHGHKHEHKNDHHHKHEHKHKHHKHH